jgi:pyruvate dehydrogenase E2 component (dihydrolipoamide acetyltransferase)
VIEIKMPRLSDTMEEGAISTWHKKPGDKVAVGDILVEIETDKAVMEYEAYEAGTLAEILVPEGQNADIGAPIALLDDGTGGPASAPAAPATETQTDSAERLQPAPAAPAASASAAGQAQAPASQARVAAVPPAATPPAATAPAATADEAVHGTANGNGAARPVASPLVRKLARENNLDLSHVTGTGPGGRIIRADISALLSGAAQADTAAPSAPQAQDGNRRRRRRFRAGRVRRARGGRGARQP